MKIEMDIEIDAAISMKKELYLKHVSKLTTNLRVIEGFTNSKYDISTKTSTESLT